MTPAETHAYNAGVAAVLALARASSVALAPKLIKMPTRIDFAMGAPHGLAEEGRAVLLAVPASTRAPPTTP